MHRPFSVSSAPFRAIRVPNRQTAFLCAYRRRYTCGSHWDGASPNAAGPAAAVPVLYQPVKKPAGASGPNDRS